MSFFNAIRTHHIRPSSVLKPRKHIQVFGQVLGLVLQMHRDQKTHVKKQTKQVLRQVQIMRWYMTPIGWKNKKESIIFLAKDYDTIEF